MKRLYVIAGKARSGKDTVAKIIKESINKKVLIYPCTIYLKKYINDIYGKYDENDKPRDILQKLGKEIKEKYPNFFITRMEEDIRFLSNYYDIIIITGVRLVKELEFLKNNFTSTLIKVESTDDNKLTEKQKQDITEIDVDNYNNYDYIIKNTNYQQLKKKLQTIMEEEI